MYPDRRNAWLAGPTFLIIIVAFISKYQEVSWRATNPTKLATITEVSKTTTAMKGIEMNLRSYVKIQASSWVGILVFLIPKGMKKARNVRIQRKVHKYNTIRERACRETARTRRRNSNELQGTRTAPRYSATCMECVGRHAKGGWAWQSLGNKSIIMGWV